jgi:4-amino-4-deoxy-L-arabinose transferase-like glycosyltransferase
MDAPMVDRSDRRGILAILAVAAASRLYEIDFPDIWVDEANLILTSGQPIGALLAKLRVDSSPPLYYLAIHFWSALFGDSALSLRSLSAISGMLLVAATWWVARELLSSEVGLWAAFYLAINPAQNFFSQQVRMYVWIALFALLSLAGLVRYLRDGRSRDFALWIGASILALYSHNFALHLGFAHAVVIATSGQLVSRARMWCLAAAIVALCYAPWIPTLWGQLGNDDHYAWYLPVWAHHGVSGTIMRSLMSFSPSLEFLTYGWLSSTRAWFGIPTLGVVALAALGSWVSVRRVRELGAAGAMWPLVGLAVPATSALIVSVWLTPNFVPGRVDQMMLPEFALLIGIGIASLRPVALRAAIGVVLVGLAMLARYEMYDAYRDPGVAGGDRAVALAIIEASQPQDVVLTTSLSRASLAYYFSRHAHEVRMLSFPRSAADHLGAQNDARLLRDPDALVREAEATLAQARSMTGNDGRLFIVWVRAKVNYPLRQEAMTQYGYDDVGNLGRFRQFGTGAIMEVRQYRLDSRPTG